MAHQVQQFREFGPFVGEGVLDFGWYFVVVGPCDQSVFFEELQSIGQDGVADIFQVVLYQLEAIVALLDTKQYVSEPSFTYEVEQLVEVALSIACR